jgi:aspartate-semialdehyde dehydrogenase
MQYRVAVLGANEPVGRELLKTLAERGFPAREVAPLGTGRVTGLEISYGADRVLHAEVVDPDDARAERRTRMRRAHPEVSE